MVIEVQDFHKVYDTTIAVEDLSFTVAGGEILGLAGPNGAGKTTTLRALAGIIQPTKGQLAISGHDLATRPVEAKRALAYVPDDPRLFERLTVYEHFQFVAATYGVEQWQEKTDRLLERLELLPKKDTIASELSRGMRQKVAIGCGYLHCPDAILLDEPLTGLDPRGIRTMKDLIREHAEGGAAIIVSSHLLSLIEDLATTILIVGQGKRLLHSTLAELRAKVEQEGKQESLEDLFFRITEAPQET